MSPTFTHNLDLTTLPTTNAQTTKNPLALRRCRSLSPMQDQQPSSPPSPGQPPATGPGRAVTTGPVATAGTDGLTLRQCHGVIDRQICANFAGTAAWCGEPDVASLCPGLCGCSYSPVDPAVTANTSSTSGGGKPVRVVPTAVVSPNTTPARPEHDPATSGTGPSGAVAEQRPYSLSECGCRFPFRHRGEVYDSCTSYGMTRHWCATQVDAAGEFVFLKERRDSWRYCDEACAPTAAALTTNPTRPPTAVAQPASIAAAAAASSTSSSPPVVTAAVVSSTVDTTFTAATFPITAEIPDSISDCGCVFPFTYAGVTHNTCTDADDPRLWCATSVDDSGFFNVRSGDWRFCDSPCPPRPTVATVGHVRPTRPPDDGPAWPVPPPPPPQLPHQSPQLQRRSHRRSSAGPPEPATQTRVMTPRAVKRTARTWTASRWPRCRSSQSLPSSDCSAWCGCSSWLWPSVPRRRGNTRSPGAAGGPRSPLAAPARMRARTLAGPPGPRSFGTFQRAFMRNPLSGPGRLGSTGTNSSHGRIKWHAIGPPPRKWRASISTRRPHPITVSVRSTVAAAAMQIRSTATPTKKLKLAGLACARTGMTIRTCRRRCMRVDSCRNSPTGRSPLWMPTRGTSSSLRQRPRFAAATGSFQTHRAPTGTRILTTTVHSWRHPCGAGSLPRFKVTSFSRFPVTAKFNPMVSRLIHVGCLPLCYL